MRPHSSSSYIVLGVTTQKILLLLPRTHVGAIIGDPVLVKGGNNL
jgi:hypothetical protein